ncbi:MAG: UDP-N-acetylmuramoyl-L-alanyl-D-glutamate--2,6-diaminopimelate ligase [Candidatus Polarisedimenticolaceae bacterium]|nr:UDP-N-acetylmuramoyl-L-alanyl-D-glutamate--2,6-diaminopimelate ligase [Candidatus Polarisedimenticolaceae bacterium]
MTVALDQQQGCSLQMLLHGIGQEALPHCYVAGLTLDSRQVTAGDLFVATSGVAGHGLNFIDDALAHGAAAVICESDQNWPESRIKKLAAEITTPLIVVAQLKQQVSLIAGRFYAQPSESLSLIGVTGTNGKSTVCQLLAQVLDGEKSRCAVIGTLGNGFPGALQPSTHTTPDPISLQRLLAEYLADDAATVVMEVSSHALSQWRAAALHFNAALLTNLSRDHLDYHPDMAAYAAAKQRLFEMPNLDCALLNYDDAFGRELISTLKGDLPVVLYTLDPAVVPPADISGWVRVDSIEQSVAGMQLQISTHLGVVALTSALLGRFNAANLAAVLALLLQRGWRLEKAAKALSKVATIPGRMERYGGGQQPLVVVDYAHTPDALEQALLALRPHCDGRLICLFGCGGDRDRGKRSLMGAVASRLSDQIILTDDNPRSEDGAEIIREIRSAIAPQHPVIVERNRASAISQAIAMASAGDLILVAGKGHETSQQIGDLTLPFSDREQVASLLQEREAGR